MLNTLYRNTQSLIYLLGIALMKRIVSSIYINQQFSENKAKKVLILHPKYINFIIIIFSIDNYYQLSNTSQNASILSSLSFSLSLSLSKPVKTNRK